MTGRTGPSGRRAARPALATLAAALSLATLACARGSGTGEPEPPPTPPDLSGARVMIVPARPGEPEPLDRELTFWLTSRAPATDWVRPEQVERVVEQNPAARFDLGAVRRLKDLGGGELRIQDPLYGDLRRIGAILDARWALVPLYSTERTDTAGVAMDLTAVLISIRGGSVVWMHTVHGTPAVERGTAVAEAAASLARTLIPDEG